MLTKIIKIDGSAPDMEAMSLAGKIIKDGGLVAFPTETVYGLGGDALSAGSSKKIYAAKGRPSDNPLIVHIADMEHLQKIVKRVPEDARVLAEKFWPGPLTMIFEKNELVPYETTGGLDTVAVRMPSHRVARILIEKSGGYIAAPSANTSGRPSPTTAAHVAEDLNGKIDMIIDGGRVNIGLESTIVDFTDEVPTILRPGYINKEMLEAVIGTVKVDPGLSSENENVRPKAPGMRYRHYAPKASLAIVEGDTVRVTEEIIRRGREELSHGKKVGVICVRENGKLYHGFDVKCIGDREDEKEIASNLYRILRQMDDDNVDRIYSEAFNTPGLGAAIMNRLLKAAGHEVIRV